jgi:broad specificity phosphatase PhoE
MIWSRYDRNLGLWNGNNLIVVRHAESAANAGLRTESPVSIPITEKGVRQARRLAGWLDQAPDMIVVSRFIRTQQTAAPIHSRFPSAALEQWPAEEFTHLNPVAYAGTTYSERSAARRLYWSRRDPLYVDGEGCESFESFVDRVRGICARLRAVPAGERVVLVTHGYVMKMLLWLQAREAHAEAHAIGPQEMAAFEGFCRAISIPNCAALAGTSSGDWLRFAPGVSLGHIPPDLRTV